MAIHPIDLSTVYSQLDNVAKYNASQNQNTQIAGVMNQEQMAQADLQKSEGVNGTPDNPETDSAKIKDQAKGQNGDDGEGSNGKNKNSSQNAHAEEIKRRIVQIKDPRLGNHVDVRR